MKTPRLTRQRLMQVLRYDRETGVFTWLESRGGVRRGSTAGTPQNRGYVAIVIDGEKFLAHRLAYFYENGEWPVRQIDHFDVNKKNNRIANLRQATNQVNSQNAVKARPNNKSGLLGVATRPRGRYQARIKIDGVSLHLGMFDHAQDAHECYVAAKRRLHEGCTL